MLQRASQYVATESLVAGKREDHKKPQGDKPQGQASRTPRRRDMPELPAPRPLSIPLNSTRTDDPEITFGDGDDAYPDYDDALVISAQIANARVKRVMVDTGRFTGDSISPAGKVVLLVTIGEELRSKILLVSFIVVALPSAYNAIIGRPTLNKLRVVVSTYHRIMKFLTRAGVGEV
ncbi:hypothetical protein B296_00014700 [Ensete ventricosum]|uniref:Uncharacterized protein n=1 Tax=Ensete ventricosum TaxID=4639 RepID=A0A426ZRF2_ENSVE|nr:hypothetical protein B296_00014700 [Ensete ventricosum]